MCIINPVYYLHFLLHLKTVHCIEKEKNWFSRLLLLIFPFPFHRFCCLRHFRQLFVWFIHWKSMPKPVIWWEGTPPAEGKKSARQFVKKFSMSFFAVFYFIFVFGWWFHFFVILIGAHITLFYFCIILFIVFLHCCLLCELSLKG